MTECPLAVILLPMCTKSLSSSFFFFVHLGISGIQQVKWVPLGFIVVLLSNGDHYFTLGHQRGSVEYHCGLVGYSKAP